jgi:hypothetical protein
VEWKKRHPKPLEPAAATDPRALAAPQPLAADEALPAGGLAAAAERYVSWVSFFRPAHKRTLYAPRNGSGSLDTLLAVDVESYLPYDLLVKMDIATMANSLEALVAVSGPQGAGACGPASQSLQDPRQRRSNIS